MDRKRKSWLRVANVPLTQLNQLCKQRQPTGKHAQAEHELSQHGESEPQQYCF
jgi:hypothetical protein